MSTSVSATPKQFLADTDAPVCRLEVKKHFDSLSSEQQLYAHFIGRASWEGAQIISRTLSEHSPKLLALFREVFADTASSSSVQSKTRDIPALKEAAAVSEDVWKHFLEYSSQVLYNLSNFKSFGDTKFIPRLSAEDFQKIVKASGSEKAASLFSELKDHIYGGQPSESLLIGFPADGHVSGYYSNNVSKTDVDTVQALLEKNDISSLNTRMLKESSTRFEVRVASADASKPARTLTGADGLEVRVTYGDFAEELKKVVENIRSAVPHAANEHQKKMLEAYVQSFESGSIEAHRQSQKHWIKDMGPVVESNIGFIETYKDPAGVRAEWEGFTAVVNKEMTLKFEVLVNRAEELVGRLPWPQEFEVDKFIKPDFTSLEVVSFATSGSPPAGINIPNYNDIRMTDGFKNVSLGNVLGAKPKDEKINFVREEDVAVFRKLAPAAFEVQVGLHELLGHGSGKILQEEPAGVFNFDQKNLPLNPVTGKPLDSWYKPGETWGSVFKASASSYEECRAEAVAMFLCVHKDILVIFGHEGQEASDIIFTCYLQMARAGLLALEFYDPKSRKWGQAHMCARYAILQVFLEAKLATIATLPDGNLEVHLDRAAIETTGVEAVGVFLQKLNVYKATGDAKRGLEFWANQTAVPDSWIKYRDIVLEKKLPRSLVIQGNTVIKEGKVELVEYPVTLEGFVQSYVERNVL
ncbi:hypothetical protein HKX48_007749 [Thoreauomyces humboldtii]|nr:hypothetical protein HKX48_007749 [Thoreauomyces humboldtii]